MIDSLLAWNQELFFPGGLFYFGLVVGGREDWLTWAVAGVLFVMALLEGYRLRRKRLARSAAAAKTP